MIELIKSSITHKSNLIYTDIFKKQKCNIALLTYNLADNEFLKDLNKHITENLLDFHFDELPEDKLESALKEYFVTLNWQINAKFKTYYSEENGISLVLAVFVENRLYLVQYGRLLCGIIDEKGFEYLGTNWENYFVKSKKELSLLGVEEKDIYVKIHKRELADDSLFFVIPSKIAQGFDTNSLTKDKVKEELHKLSKKHRFPYCIIHNRNFVKKKTSSFFQNLHNRIIAVVLLIIVILATLYVFFGKNWLDEQQLMMKKKNREFIQNDLMQNLVETQKEVNNIIEKIFQNKYQFSLFPNQKIKPEKVAEIELDSKIISRPLFDTEFLFINLSDKVIKLDKELHKIVWDINFDSKVIDLQLLDANRLLILLKNQSFICINRLSQEIIWEKSVKTEFTETQHKFSSYQISLNQYKRLDNSVIFIPTKKSLQFYNNISGDSLFVYQAEDYIDFVSDFDIMTRSFYLVMNKKLIKIRLNVIN